MVKKFNIMVVDDDLNNIQVGINFLKQNKDYHLLFATSGQQALERVKEINFDLILLDIIMPVMDGYEVCKQLKLSEETRQIPVIFLTAKHETDSLMKGFEVGGADYVTKPFNAAELNARVKTHLELHHYYKKEIKKLEEVLLCSQKAETIKFIAGGIAHDCNNFMTSIPANLHMIKSRMQKNGIATDDYDQYIEGANTAVGQVSDLLKQLAEFSSQDETKIEIVDMNEVVSDLNKVYKGSYIHNISFKINFLNQPALADANKLHVEQVVLNLLINAQHAILARAEGNTESGYIQLTIAKESGGIHGHLVNEKPYLCLTIEDNGVGMSDEVMEKIFDPYFTTRKDSGGTGLGLAVSMKIVQSYGGIIDVISEVGKGSKFQIYFPFCTRQRVNDLIAP